MQEVENFIATTNATPAMLPGQAISNVYCEIPTASTQDDPDQLETVSSRDIDQSLQSILQDYERLEQASTPPVPIQSLARQNGISNDLESDRLIAQAQRARQCQAQCEDIQAPTDAQTQRNRQTCEANCCIQSCESLQ